MRGMQGRGARKSRKDDFIRISFQLPTALHEQFRAVAASEHRTVSAELRRLMERRVAQIEQLEEAA